MVRGIESEAHPRKHPPLPPLLHVSGLLLLSVGADTQHPAALGKQKRVEHSRGGCTGRGRRKQEEARSGPMKWPVTRASVPLRHHSAPSLLSQGNPALRRTAPPAAAPDVGWINGTGHIVPLQSDPVGHLEQTVASQNRVHRKTATAAFLSSV
jgi:hypothetical protein